MGITEIHTQNWFQVKINLIHNCQRNSLVILNNVVTLGKAVTFEEPHIVSREKWKAERPKKAQATKNFPLSYLVLMHTNTPVCKTKKECKETLRQLQKKHMDEGAPDILHK